MPPDPGNPPERGGDESPECRQGSPENPGAVLGASVPRASVAVRDGLHVPQGTEEGPAEQVLRSYFPMQEEKDNRVYGAQDGAIRGNMFRQVQERWLEWQKLFLSIIPLPEISAARAMPLLFRTVPNPELHNGQAIQMIDEVRHSTIQQNLKRLYMNNYIDPAGFNNSLRNFQNDYCGTIGRQFAEGFITGDAITAASIYLTIVAETAFTNTLFV